MLTGAALIAALRDSRARTWALVDGLTPAQWLPPLQEGVNPIAWELAHLAWFAEFWVLRGPHEIGTDGLTQAEQPPRFAGPDAYLDSARLAHPARWSTPMPTHLQLTAMMATQLEACIDAMPAAGDDASLYLHRLALFHEDMHGEALCWLRASLGYPAPGHMTVPQVSASRPLFVRGGALQMGVKANAPGFAFDNERPGRLVCVPDFEIDSAPVTALAFARFVDAGGYDEPRYWPHEAGAWRAHSARNHPQLWRRNAGVDAGTHADGNGHGGAPGGWQTRWFDQWLPLEPGMPAMHLNAYEAEAYCLWAGRQLPSAAQWEYAATQNVQHTAGGEHSFQWGHSVWEWTADAFKPYCGFAPGPYKEYSAPWFGNHRELRGGAFATHARLHDARYRNFFLPHRTDVFAGFRTVAPC
jgi:gamma-glutamyl hercynylcysteine S-oxide synthase